MKRDGEKERDGENERDGQKERDGEKERNPKWREMTVKRAKSKKR